MLLNRTDPVKINRAMGALVSVSNKLGALKEVDLQWIAKHPEEAIKLFIDAVDLRDKAALETAEVTFVEENKG